LTSATGAGASVPLDFADPFAGLVAADFLAAGLAGVLAATLLGGFLAIGAAFFDATVVAGDFLTTTFVGAAFWGTTAFFAAGDCVGKLFFAAVFFAMGFFAGAAFFGGAAFFADGLATFLGFVAIVFGLAVVFFAVGGVADFTVWPDFAGGLLTFFTAVPFADAVFDAAVLRLFALFEAFSLCAFAAPELRVVFAISLHRGWPWRPGVIAQLSFTGKPGSGILLTLQRPDLFGSMNPLTQLILWLLHLYKRWLSPLLGPNCRFHPSCSEYARIAVIRFGPWRGSSLAVWRLLRCQPLCSGGEDPVPEHFHYPRCHGHDESRERQ
jgi:putative membrane protein insertion efficiency factor